MKTRSDQIFDRFKKFHKQNPRVWKLFESFTWDVVRAGHKRYSSDAVFHRIRWFTEIETRGEALKLNDHYTSLYARLFMVIHPELNGFFSIRKRISRRSEPHQVDILVVNPTEDQDPLHEELVKLANQIHRPQTGATSNQKDTAAAPAPETEHNNRTPPPLRCAAGMI